MALQGRGSPRDSAGSGEKETAAARAARLALAGDLAGAEVAFRAAWASGDPAAGLGLLACLRARGATEKARVVLETLRARGVEVPPLDDDGDVAPPALVARGLRFDWAGEHLDLGCGACGRTFDVAVASWMAVLTATCPACGLVATFEPEALAAIAARFDPPIPAPVADTLDAATIRIVAGWHREPAFGPVLDVAGMNVGALAEQMVFPLVLDAVLAAYRERK